MAFAFSQGDRPLPGYTILRGVGRGGFGEVYYATSDGGKEVALKYLRENPAVELRGVQHCLNLKSPYLVGIHDIRQNTDGDYFVVMEFVNGPSLRDLLNDAPNGLGPQKAAYLTREIGKGLAYLHDRGIVHRDLKPGNIFYEDGYVKIGDYGLAKMMAASQHSGQTVSVGTVHYMAPEVGSGNYDRTIDVYAMGVMLYEMLLGRVPFAGATMGEVLMKHLTAQPAVDELPAPFPDVIRKALAKDPKDRYQTVGELIADLFSVSSLDESVAAFEPGSLSQAARRVAQDINATMSASPRPGGVAVVGAGSSNVGGPLPPPIIPRTGRTSDRFGESPKDGGGRLPRLAERLTGRLIGNAARKYVDPTAPRGSPAEKLVVALLIACGLSIGISFVAPERGGSQVAASTVIFTEMLAVVQGVWLGTWLGYGRLNAQGAFIPRVLMAAFAWIAMMGNSALWSGLDSWARAMVPVMLFCDWDGRLYVGRRGIVSLGSAFYAGVCGLICGAIFTNHDAATIGGIAAAASLTLQAVAGMFPMAPGEVVPASIEGSNSYSQEGLEAEPKSPAARTNDSLRPFVAVEMGVGDSGGDADRGERRAKWGFGSADPKLAALSHESDQKDHRESQIPRSSGVRALWLLCAGVLQCTAILCFAAQAFMPEMRGDDQAISVLCGIVAENGFLYALTRSIRKYRIGLWRGVIRPGIFFLGTATASSAGAAMGLLKLDGESQFIALGFLLFGAMISLFVWFIPSPPPLTAAPPQTRDEAFRRNQLASRLKFAGVAGLVLTGALLTIFGITLSGNDMEDIAPPTCIPLGIGSVGMIVAGFWKGRARREPVEKVELPIKRVFDVDSSVTLSSIMERHMALLGYQLENRSELLWCFTRGQWMSHLWQSDIQKWKSRVNIAAYRLDNGDHRVTCRLDLEADFNQPSQKMLSLLKDELVELQRILNGRDVISPFGGEARS
ncbi:Serine/threonine-protein kinase PrkC [Phycisphaerae bacterium RAS2]|nr:Serine/threonine-protein kinase PrkC [Phycisphaerae bacterium RAS2]